MTLAVLKGRHGPRFEHRLTEALTSQQEEGFTKPINSTLIGVVNDS